MVLLVDAISKCGFEDEVHFRVMRGALGVVRAAVTTDRVMDTADEEETRTLVELASRREYREFCRSLAALLRRIDQVAEAQTGVRCVCACGYTASFESVMLHEQDC